MCISIVCVKEFPTKDVLKKCEEKNGDGGGMAWVEGGKVRYKKGIGYKRMWNMIQKIKLPALLHFRLASVGGVKRSLCHPFPIGNGAPTRLDGEADQVLIHNGHWSGWREVCLSIVSNRAVSFPRGPWSDSRAMAWLAETVGRTALELLDEKIALLTNRKKITIFGTGWTQRHGIFYSNTIWDVADYLGGVRSRYGPETTPYIGYGSRYPLANAKSAYWEKKDKDDNTPTDAPNSRLADTGGKEKDDENEAMLREEFERDTVTEMQEGKAIFGSGYPTP